MKHSSPVGYADDALTSVLEGIALAHEMYQTELESYGTPEYDIEACDALLKDMFRFTQAKKFLLEILRD